MSLHHASSQQSLRSLDTDTATLRLQGRTLVVTRMLWIAGAIAVLVVFFGTLPANFVYLHTASTTGIAPSFGEIGQITPHGLRQLQELGLSINFYATFISVDRVIFVLVWLMVGGVIFWRKSDERMALLASFALIMFSISFSDIITLAALPVAWWLPLEIMKFLGGLIFSIFLYTFPNGRFVPRWTPWLLIGWAIEESGVTFFSAVPLNDSLRSLINGFLFIGLLGSVLASQIYRYRRVSTLTQRQQTKWVVFGMTIAIVGFVVTLIIGSSFFSVGTPQSNPLSTLIGNTFLDLFLLLIPFSIGFAILRSHLWDIDAIINKALVYGLLTGILGAFYAGLIIGLESLFGAITGQTAANPLVLVISTLAIYVLFQPIRRRIQQIIDRRFYRRKYDAARTLAAFSATLRDEVDLSTLSEHLIAVVEETIQPAHISLWLRQPVSVDKQRNAMILE